MTSKKSVFANLLKKRILVLDGAMGTMIQDYELEESDFKGTRFSKHKKDLIFDASFFTHTMRASHTVLWWTGNLTM